MPFRSLRRRMLLPIAFSICLFIVLYIQPFKEIVVRAVINFPKLDNNADFYVKLSVFIFCISAARDITSASLKLCAKLFLRDAVSVAQSTEIISDTPITAKLLFHISLRLLIMIYSVKSLCLSPVYLLPMCEFETIVFTISLRPTKITILFALVTAV